MSDPIRVLYVDDEPDFADMAATFIEREDERLDVETATTASEGLDRFATDGFDCVVSDYDMPGMDGIELLNEVREKHPDLPFILYTGKGSEAIASEAISAGVTDYMQKESDTDQYTILANRVRNAVRQYRSQKEAERMQRRLEEVTESATDCIWIFSRNWDELLFISGYEEVWGRSVEAVKENPRDFLQGVHPEDRDFVRDAMETVSNGRSADIEYRIQKDDDETGWVWVKGEPVFDAEGNVIRVVGFTREITDRKTRERKLQEERDFVEQAINTLDDVFYVVDTDRTLRRWNDRLEETTGYDEEEIAEMDAVDFFPKDQQHRISNAITETLEAGEATVEAELQTAQGERIPHEFINARLTDPDGQLAGVVGVGRDISAQQDREGQLQRSLARLEALFENSPDLINIHDTDGNIINPNPHLCAKTGYDAAELADMKVWDLDQSIDPDEANELWERMEVGDSHRLEGVYQCRDGTTFPVEIHIQRLSFDSKDRFVAISRDITERKGRKKDLIQYERIVECLDDIATVIDPDGTVTYVSPSVRRILGYDPEELIGENGFEFQPKATAEAVTDAIKYVIENPGDSKTVQTKFRRADGSFCWIESTLRNRLDDDVIEGILVSSRDITERRNDQEQLQRQNERLDAFASVVSHDLRNPLTVAEGNLELLREEHDSQHLDAVGRALERMDTLIDDLLTLARKGERISETEPVALAELTETCWQNVETGEAAIHTTVDRTIKADRSRLAQLLENLIRNAVEHGGGDVTVTIGEMNDGFYIEDDGSGISQAGRETIFDAGYSTAENGTGFGLSITEQIADAHGWDIHVIDGTDGGARFEITAVKFAE